MGKAPFVVSISVTIQRFFSMSWYQKLDTFIYYQGGEVLFIAFVLFEIIARLN